MAMVYTSSWRAIASSGFSVAMILECVSIYCSDSSGEQCYYRETRKTLAQAFVVAPKKDSHGIDMSGTTVAAGRLAKGCALSALA